MTAAPMIPTISLSKPAPAANSAAAGRHAERRRGLHRARPVEADREDRHTGHPRPRHHQEADQRDRASHVAERDLALTQHVHEPEHRRDHQHQTRHEQHLLERARCRGCRRVRSRTSPRPCRSSAPRSSRAGAAAGRPSCRSPPPSCGSDGRLRESRPSIETLLSGFTTLSQQLNYPTLWRSLRAGLSAPPGTGSTAS